MKIYKAFLLLLVVALSGAGSAYGLSEAFKGNIYQTGKLKPTDSVLRVKVGEIAPDFTLPAISGEKVTLSQYRGKRHVVISFVPAAWTPVCSDQWPGYAILQDLFSRHNAVLLGITVDNIPTLFAWTNQMGKLWFPVLSDFWPHGKVADTFGVLRSDGTAERAIIIIDKGGIIRYIDVNDINKRPFLESIIKELEKLGE
ncbi:MAG: redoxin domain-containing protein [Deltaproteobacteria bacterium]|nr:redoxin domain-containing protein [Deltaproteobacteria bacterium]